MMITRLMAGSLASPLLLLAGLNLAFAPATAHAQNESELEAARYYDEELDDIEWEAGEGYHEEEWYDPSDWFDADEGTEYEYDGWYGYDDDTSPNYDTTDDWYYDYYTGDNYIYDYGDDDGVYRSTSDFYDYDGDGEYEAYASYHDWDGDGLYEDYNYYSFTSLENADQQAKAADQQARDQAQQKQQQKSSKEFRLTGQVKATKKVQVRQRHNLVAQVEGEQGTVNVDLGPADEASQWNISEGTQLVAQGPMTQVGDKKLLLARNVKIGDKQASIDRSHTKATGTITSLRKAQSRGTQHQLAVIEVKEKKKKLVVDMGPADTLSHDFAKGDQITAHGFPVRINERPVLMAQKVEHQNETIKIARREQERSSK